jgi:hypothetical protein
MDCRVFHHDHCFDGACSAAVFTRFHRECIGTVSQYSYFGLMHKAGAQFDEASFGAGDNAIVDFKYCLSPKVTWWFDHHLSAFMTAEDRADFDAFQVDGPGPVVRGGKFYDADYVSCTGLILDVAVDKFGFNAAGLEELRYWADIVDGAKYESAQAAVEMAAPAMKLTMCIESSGAGFVPRVIPLLTAMSLQEVLDQPFVQAELGPLMARHRAGIDVMRGRAHLEAGVITFDITDTVTEGYNKFIPYYLLPEATYTVGLSRSSFRTKISVGTNPWTTRSAEGLANIAAICERFGGGGHARVGAISFPANAVETARVVAAEIAGELRGG